MTTIKQALTRGYAVLEAVGITSHKLDTELLLAHCLGKQRVYTLSHPETLLTPPQIGAFEILLTKRASRRPLVQLTHSREFYGLDFFINEHVLTPRVETELIAEWAISLAPKNSFLIDIGTGSGAIAIAIAKHRPDLAVYATEISSEALDVAKQNAKKHNVTINFILSDLFDNVPAGLTFQTFVTNLPYLKNDALLMPEVTYEPKVALFGGKTDGLDIYRRFLLSLPLFAAPFAKLITECDPWQQADLVSLAKTHGFEVQEQSYFIMSFHGTKL